jgi:MFS family permease
LLPDGRPPAPGAADGTPAAVVMAEPHFSRAQALRTPAFWLLSLYTIAVYPVQAGISLHQAPHLLESGLSPSVAATVVSTFSLTAALAGLGFGLVARRLGLRTLLAISGAALGTAALLMLGIASAWQAYLAAGAFGAGIGGITTLLPLAWADYFGRASFGAIRGVALSLQVTAQAAGPLLSGLLRDLSGSYVLSLTTFAAFSFFSALIALLIRAPRAPRARHVPDR